jgi:methylenetetrahydrofolate reductase (NADPH)
MSSEAALEVSPAALLEDFSLEMTGKDVGKLEQARPAIPPGTRINVTFLGHEDLDMRLAAARAVREYGFVPVPHISARRLASREQFAEFLSALQAQSASEHVFVVAGDPAEPQGPYPDAVTILRSEELEAYGVRRVSVAGYPEGHPQIPAGVLWTALADKAAVLRDTGLGDSIITQFGFDASAVLSWVEQVRHEGITLPVRVGVPGPAGVRRLLSYASRFGVSTSKGIARKYGLSLTNLMSTAGPDKFLRELAAGYDTGRHGEIKLHFYTFGGLAATSEWISNFSGTLEGR